MAWQNLRKVRFDADTKNSLRICSDNYRQGYKMTLSPLNGFIHNLLGFILRELSLPQADPSPSKYLKKIHVKYSIFEKVIVSADVP